MALWWGFGRNRGDGEVRRSCIVFMSHGGDEFVLIPKFLEHPDEDEEESGMSE